MFREIAKTKDGKIIFAGFSGKEYGAIKVDDIIQSPQAATNGDLVKKVKNLFPGCKIAAMVVVQQGGKFEAIELFSGNTIHRLAGYTTTDRDLRVLDSQGYYIPEGWE